MKKLAFQTLLFFEKKTIKKQIGKLFRTFQSAIAIGILCYTVKFGKAFPRFACLFPSAIAIGHRSQFPSRLMRARSAARVVTMGGFPAPPLRNPGSIAHRLDVFVKQLLYNRCRRTREHVAFPTTMKRTSTKMNSCNRSSTNFQRSFSYLLYSIIRVLSR